jgi:gamma-glutamylcyclotransferase (GGCT)/AIG2-like uncharacterized protein YtfP
MTQQHCDAVWQVKTNGGESLKQEQCNGARDMRIVLDGEQYIVCADHFNTFIGMEVEKGEESFIDFAIDNFSDQAPIIAERIFEGAYDKAVKRMAGELVQMFTYGILKYPSNIESDGGVGIVENCTVSGHEMFLYNGSFPITRETEQTYLTVKGTLFSIPQHTLRSYDRIEGYVSSRPEWENMYNRKTVQVRKPNGEVVEAQMYIANPAFFSGHYNVPNMILSGNFDDARTRNKYAKAGRRGTWAEPRKGSGK